MEIWHKRCAKEYVKYEVDRKNGTATKFNLYLNHRVHKQKDVSHIMPDLSTDGLKARGYKLRNVKVMTVPEAA